MDKVPEQLAAAAADELKYFPRLVSNRKNPKHIRFVADKIQYAVENPNPDKYKLLVIHAPPRHGKSDLISVHTPAWIEGKYKNKKIICASYSSDLAKDHNGMARDILREWGPVLWDTYIHPKKQNQSLWRTLSGGACKASGVGGPITGFGADVFIIDDYCKGREEAESEVMRRKIWSWWEAVVATRLHPGAVVIILATRWHDDDLIGRLKAQHKKCEQIGEEFPFDFEDICLPAIAEVNKETGPDLIGRKDGQALWPWRYSEKLLARVEKIVGAYEWAALFRGNPVSRGGNLFKSVYFRYWDIDTKNGDYVCHRVDSEPIRIRKTELTRKVFVDPAVEDKRKNDPTGMAVWGYSRKHKVWLLLDVLVDRIEHTKILKQTLLFAFKNNATEIVVENEKLGKVLVKQSAGNDQVSSMKIPFREYPRGTLDKYAHATPMATYVENERVFFLRGAPWLAEYEDYLVKFPNVKHDEHIDITSMAAEMETKVSVAEILAQKNK